MHIWVRARSGRAWQREFNKRRRSARDVEVAVASLELLRDGPLPRRRACVSASSSPRQQLPRAHARFAGPSHLVGSAALVAQARRLRVGPPALGVPGLNACYTSLCLACRQNGHVGVLARLAAQVRLWCNSGRNAGRALAARGDTRRRWFETGLRASGAHASRRVVRSLFFKEEMELSLIGLNAAGKTSLVNVIAVRRASARGLPPARSSWRSAARVPACTHARSARMPVVAAVAPGG